MPDDQHGRVAVMTTTRQVILHHAEEGGYWIEVPSLPGCFSQGETKDEALANIKEAITLHLESANRGRADRDFQRKPFA